MQSTSITLRTRFDFGKAVVELCPAAYPAGMGWFIANARGHRVVFHTGGGFGFYSDISRYLDDRLTIIVMANIGEAHTGERRCLLNRRPARVRPGR